MAFVKLQTIKDQMLNKQLPFFSIKEGNQVVDLQDDEGVSVDAAVEQLESIVESIESGILEIALSNKSKKQKAKGGADLMNFTYKIRIGESKKENESGSLALIREIYELKADLQKKDFEHRMEELERIMSKKEKKPAFDLDHPLAQQAITGLLTHFAGGSAPVANHTGIADNVSEPEAPAAETKTKRMTPEEKKTLTESIQRLSKVDPDIINTLVKLANLAESNPGKYNMAKTFL